MTPAFQIHRVAERALLVRFLDDDLARAVARSTAALLSLSGRAARESERGAEPAREKRLSTKGEWIPGAGNLLLRIGESASESEVAEAEGELQALLRSLPLTESFSRSREISTVVRFGGADGQDLPAVASETGLSESQIVARLCAAELTVAFVGFAPGFPYLVGLPPELEVRRLASPRTMVPAGSVAIAGPFAGIYPAATPGGWRLVGRTGLALFDPGASPPAHLAPGDQVRFVPS